MRHLRSDAYSAEQVLLNKRQIWGGTPKLDQIKFWGTEDSFIVYCALMPILYSKNKCSSGHHLNGITNTQHYSNRRRHCNDAKWKQSFQMNDCRELIIGRWPVRLITTTDHIGSHCKTSDRIWVS